LFSECVGDVATKGSLSKLFAMFAQFIGARDGSGTLSLFEAYQLCSSRIARGHLLEARLAGE
jgi:hypothetical protein